MAEFDYSGWEHYNEWRRCITVHKFEKKAAVRGENGGFDEEVEMYEYTGQKNCWNDCDYPSECQRLQEEIPPRRMAAPFVETKVKSPVSGTEDAGYEFKGKFMEIDEWGAEMQRQKLEEFKKAEREMEELEKFAVAVYGGPESSSKSSATTTSSHSSYFSSTAAAFVQTAASMLAADEMDVVDMERRGLEGEAQMVDISLGPISSSEVGLKDEEEHNGSEFASKHRKKSIQKIAQLMGLMLGVEPVERGNDEEKPNSPLKEEFTFRDKLELEIMGREREIVEEERSGSDYRRMVARGEVAEFGDEVEL